MPKSGKSKAKEGRKVSLRVKQVARQGRFIKDHLIKVEENKLNKERGFYCYLQGYGQSRAKGILWARR